MNLLSNVVKQLGETSFVKIKGSKSTWLITFNTNEKFNVTRLTNGIVFEKEYEYPTDFLMWLSNFVKRKDIVLHKLLITKG